MCPYVWGEKFVWLHMFLFVKCDIYVGYHLIVVNGKNGESSSV